MYMVTFTSSEGKPGNHWADSLDEALKFVERVRNGEGVVDTKVFEMREIPLEVKAYYKVELASSNGSPESDLQTEEHDEPAIVDA